MEYIILKKEIFCSELICAFPRQRCSSIFALFYSILSFFLSNALLSGHECDVLYFVLLQLIFR